MSEELHWNCYGERKVVCAKRTVWLNARIVIHEDMSGVPVAVEVGGVLYEQLRQEAKEMEEVGK